MSDTFDAVIVGAGFAGLYMLHRLRGLGFSARVYEAGSGVGGTWYWNRYPGARCDVESLEYSYSFSEELSQEWQWTERYATQPEILRYLNHVADRFDLKRDIQLDTRVTAATFDEIAQRWDIRTDGGDRVTAQFCIMATGCLSAAKIPDYPGRDSFQGKTYHTGHWPHEGVDFTAQRVAVIGTGSSGIQSIPIIAEQASQTFRVPEDAQFQRAREQCAAYPDATEDWKVNGVKYRQRARIVPFGMLFEEPEKSALEASAEERQREYEKRWRRGGVCLLGSFTDLIYNKAANDTATEFVHSKIRGIVRDPAVAEKLLPRSHPIATKRLCVDTGYYATFNRDNVTLVDARATPIEEITRTGLRTSDAEFAVDSIVFATGFDAMTGALCSIDIHGRGGVTLQQKWSEGPRTYLGIMMAGFPNLFAITGPGSPSVFSNMAVSIEQHVDWIAGCVGYLRERRLASIEATADAENAWVAHVNDLGDATLFPLANSWYMGDNIPGKPRVFMPYIGGVGVYRQKCDEVAAKGYEGFVLTAGSGR